MSGKSCKEMTMILVLSFILPFCWAALMTQGIGYNSRNIWEFLLALLAFAAACTFLVVGYYFTNDMYLVAEVRYWYYGMVLGQLYFTVILGLLSWTLLDFFWDGFDLGLIIVVTICQALSWFGVYQIGAKLALEMDYRWIFP